MNKKSILGLLLFGCLVLAGLFYGATLMTRFGTGANANQMNEKDTKEPKQEVVTSDSAENTKDIVHFNEAIDITDEEPWLSANPSDNLDMVLSGIESLSEDLEEENSLAPATNINGGIVLESPVRELIKDCTQVDYEAYVPAMVYNSTLEAALAISNPSIQVKAEAAILFDAETRKVLYYKEPVKAVYPASTAKLLTALTALDWCKLDEEVTIGKEVKMIASDSTRANLYAGEILTMKSLLEGMLLPSGNDAAYAIATFVGRRSLQKPDASAEDAVMEFVRLMNEKAKKLGVVNSCFKTPDGYDALGQYTTAYDMGMIGLAAMENETVMKITKKSDSRNVFISGEDVTWYNTNALINRSSSRYYSYCIGLKTGTSTMAGRCLIAAGRKNGREVLSVVMNSSSSGRWNDSTTLLKYGLDR